MSIGTKIKSLRKLKGMTQAELSNGIVTRNMLSSIENGNATPSLDTLIAIAKRLGVPAGYFLYEDSADPNYIKSAYIDEIKALFRNREYADCIRICEVDLPEIDDEIALVLAECHAHLARSNCNTGNFSLAAKHIASAQEYAKKTLYQTEHITIMTSFLSLLMERIHDFGIGHRITEKVPLDFPLVDYLYIKALDLYNSGKEIEANALRLKLTATSLSEVKQEHLLAKEQIYEGDITTALERLFSIEKSRADSLSLFMLCSIYQDMEYCFNLQEDFRMAYVYFKKREDKLATIR